MITEMVDLLIKNGMVITMDPEMRVLDSGDVTVSGDEITAVEVSLPFEAKKVIDAGDHLVMPGLVNPHMHETITRGLAEDLPLERWLTDICFPLDRSYTADVMRAAAMMSQMELIRGGTTTFLDIYRHPSACAEIAEVSGLRAVFAPQIIIDPPGVGETLEEAVAFVEGWLGRNKRITPAFGHHAPYSCPPAIYKRVAELAEKYGVLIHTHLSETRWEVDLINERYGLTPPGHLDRLGVLGPKVSIAHGVKLSPKDIELLAERGVSVVHTPTSNMKLASGIAPVTDMMAAGIRLGLGTDSNLSNNNLDLFEEMRTAAILQKLARADTTILPSPDMVAMATIGGAGVLNMAGSIGSLEPGKQADIILLDLNQPHLWPLLEGVHSNVFEHIVYSANAADVTHTIVAGRVLMEERKVLSLDAFETRLAVNEAMRRLLTRAGLEYLLPAGESREPAI